MHHSVYQKKLRKFIPIISTALYCLFRVLEIVTRFKIFALWYHDQFCLYAIPKPKKKDLHILISKSFDGEIIAQAVEKMGFSAVRGSKNKITKDKGGKEATFEIITKLKEGKMLQLQLMVQAAHYIKLKME